MAQVLAFREYPHCPNGGYFLEVPVLQGKMRVIQIGNAAAHALGTE